jgi:hypothetical protein
VAKSRLLSSAYHLTEQVEVERPSVDLRAIDETVVAYK